MAYNSNNFSLQNWKLTLPVDSNGGTSGEAKEILNLIGYESTNFYDAPDGAMVFIARANGATTSGSSYPRNELREMNDGKLAAWNLNQGGTMTATLKVDQTPGGRIIVGQIHGQDEELVRLYYDNGSMYFMNDRAGSGNKETKFTFANSSGQQPSVSIGEQFSYKIDARGSTLKVEIYADGQTYTSTSQINSVWQSDTFYFKAGLYLGVNSGSAQAQVSFYGLDFGHTPGSGLGGLTPGSNPPSEPGEPPPVPNPNPEIVGTSSGETLAGTDAANVIRALGGNDTVRAGDGADTVYGGDGNDALYGDAKNDMLYGDSGTDTLQGGSGDDILVGGSGSDTATGGEGRDTFVVSRGDGGLTITDFMANSSGDILLVKGYSASGLEDAELIRSGSDMILRFDDGAQVTFKNMTQAQMANAVLQAEVNNTVVAFKPDGGTVTPPPDPEIPNPTKVGTSGKDTINGKDGVDDVIMAKAGNDTVNGEDGDDKIYGEDGEDKLYGNDDDDTLYGGGGKDSLYGEDDNDILYGGAGDDKLFGGNGDDILHGGAGRDTLTGGDGEDIFVFDSLPDIHDIIADFDADEDRIDLDTLLGSKGVASIKEVSDDNSGLYVDIDGAGSAKAILIATFEDEISSNILSKILV